MKTILFALLVLTFAITGCNKDPKSIDQPLNPERLLKHSVTDNRLVFSSLTEYHELIEDLCEKSEDELIDQAETDTFTSMFEFYESNNDLNNLPADDIILALILNPQGIVQINNYVFKVDLVNETVLVYQLSTDESQNQSKITDMINNIKSSGILQYSTTDNLIDLLDGTFEEASNCPGEKLGYYYWNTSGGQVMYKIVYQKAGIYFSLQSKIKKDHYGGAEFLSISTYDHSAVGGTNFWKHKKKCDTFFKYDSGYGREYNIRPYAGTRALTDYLFSISYYCSDNGTPYSSVLTLDCGNIQKKCN